MPIAVGMYLPFDTSSAIFVGGAMKWVADRLSAKYAPERKAIVEERGTLLASGVIAGEAIVGILLAVVFLAGIPAIATVPYYDAWGGWLSFIGFAAVAWVLIRIPVRARV
ncbi:MAG: OPT/YSL family transporter [Bryobacteraceae bacterium]